MKKYVCGVCGYIYDEEKGCPENGNVPGTLWASLSDSWKCPLCGAAKSEFRELGGETVPVQSVPVSAGEKTDLKELSAREMSIVCSNLARGCEKQYRAEEAGLFRDLAAWFRSAAGPAEPADLSALLSLIDADLQQGIPAASAAASAEPRDRGALRALVWSEKVSRILKSLLSRRQKEGDAMLAGSNVYVCTICGFIYIGSEPPALCPVCKVPGWKFEKIEGRAQ